MIGGVVVGVDTIAGQSAAGVIVALAAAINADPALATLGETATAFGGALATDGQPTLVSIADAGLSRR